MVEWKIGVRSEEMKKKKEGGGGSKSKRKEEKNTLTKVGIELTTFAHEAEIHPN